MPTREQLRRMREAEMEFPEIRRDYVPKPHFDEPFTGERIGIIKVDPETGDLKIIPDIDEKE